MLSTKKVLLGELQLYETFGDNYLSLTDEQTPGEALMVIIIALQNQIVALEQGRKTKEVSLTIHNLRATLSALHCFGAFYLGSSSGNMCYHGQAQENHGNGFHVCEDCLPC